MNISLIKEYHENMPHGQARQIALLGLARLELQHIASKRNPALSSEERFCAMLLRAAMVRDATLIIDRPFSILPHLNNIQYVTDVLKLIDDLYLNCHIYDYSWMQGKYGVL